MKLLMILIVLAIIVLLAVVAYKVATEGVEGLSAWFKRRERRHGLWQKEETKGEDGLEVYLVEPGTDRRVLVEADDQYGNLLSCARWGGDFEWEIELLRSAANQRLIALNSDRKQLR
jgi:hypothetical protein